jgi:acyl-CoA synthetase (AMP-forming)/AMP-acid ligase II
MACFANAGALIVRDRDLAKTAVVDLAGAAPRDISFADLDAAAAGVALGLLKRGLAPGERAAILAENSGDFLAAFFGILRAGLVAVPVNHRFPRETIESILADCDARLVFCDAARRPLVPDGLPAVALDALADFADPGPFEPPALAEEPALFLYTSGSTGKPKGVVLSHRSQIWTVETRLAGEDLSRHRFLVAAPLYHMNALALSQLAAAAHATIVLLPHFTASSYIDAIARHRPTYLTAVPPMIAMMLAQREAVAATDFSCVEILRMGSAPVSGSLMAAVRRALPRAKVTNAYGTTEAGPVVFGPHPAGLPTPDLSVGYPHPAVSLRLAGGGDEGVLEMKCPALMSGYHNRPELRPFTADGYYVTGDLFRRDENGFHIFVGRSDDMFVSGGENIFPAEVERMLERHPAVSQACVVPVPDELKGQKPVAFIVPRPGEAPGAEEIKAFALAHAPAFQHPRFVWFLDALPLAATNKIDRAQLIRLAAERTGAGGT